MLEILFPESSIHFACSHCMWGKQFKQNNSLDYHFFFFFVFKRIFHLKMKTGRKIENQKISVALCPKYNEKLNEQIPNTEFILYTIRQNK